MREALLVVACALFAAAGPAASQEKQEQKEQKPAAPEGRPRLNLKLDNPAQFTRETPREGGTAALPTLGGDARPIPTTPSPTTTRPFPKDSERGEW